MNLRLLLIGMAAWGSVACAETGQYPPVIDHSTYQPGVPQPARAPSGDAVIELVGRLEQLQSEVQTLRGQVEEQSHLIEELQRRQTNIYNDLDSRLQKLEPAGASGSASPATSENADAPQASAEAQPVPGGSAAPATEPSGAAPAQSAEHVAAGTGVVSEPATQQPEEAVAPNAAEEEQQALPSDEAALYREADAAIKNGRYEQALQMLNKLVSDYPDSKNAEDAYFRLGVLNYTIKRDAAAARMAFEYQIAHYPKGRKVSDAMLKLGFLEYDQHNPDKAKELFNAIITRFPGSSAAGLAKNKLQQMSGQKR